MCQIFIRERRGVYSSICVNLFVGKRRGGYSSICVKFPSGSDAAHVASYVSNFIGKRRGACSSICVKFFKTVAARCPTPSHMQLHMCQFFIRERRGACSSICVIFSSRSDACSSICVKFSSGRDAAYIAPYASNFSGQSPRTALPRRICSFICVNFHQGATRRICSSICVNFSSRSDAADM